MIYFLFGADDYRIKEKSDEIKNFYQQKYPNMLGFDVYDFEEKNVFDEFKNFFETTSMFAPQKLAIAYNPFNSPEFKKIADFLMRSDLKDSKENNLIIIQNDFDEEKVKKLSKDKKEFFDFLKKEAKAQTFQPFKDFSEALPWLKTQLKKYNIKIELPALKILFENFKNSSYQLINELLKTSLLKPEEKITLKEVETISSFEINPDFFAIFDTFFDGNKKALLFNLEKSLKGGIDEGQIFNYFIKQVRTAIYILNHQTEKIEAPPFVINKIKRKLMHWSNAKEILPKIYDQLAKIDWLIKKGVIDYQTALEILITHLK
ncbi:MAG: DNA polymerase III subunit delta [Minisyncoccia bacterium]